MKKMRKAVTVILAAVFVFGICMMLRQLLQYGDAEQVYDQAQQIAFGTEPTQPSTEPSSTDAAESTKPYQPEQILPEEVKILQNVDIAALQLVNPDVLGWIYIPDTVVSYPLMQTQERDEYLYKAWDGSTNNSGSIFLEKSNHRDFSDFNTIIYGHHMSNSTMFGSLKEFRSQDYRDSHPYIYIAAADGIRRYEVFAAYEAGIESDTYRLYFEDDTRKQASVDAWVSNSLIKTDVIPSVEDNVLTLSTCMGTGQYSTRWVVQAVLTGFWEK